MSVATIVTKKLGPPMAKKPQNSRPEEERRAEAATIGWMLSTLATLAAMVCSLGAYLLVRPMDKPPLALAVLPGLLLVIAAVAGLVVLGLTPVVLKLRKTRPPPLITRGAMLVGAAPSMLLVVIQFL